MAAPEREREERKSGDEHSSTGLKGKHAKQVVALESIEKKRKRSRKNATFVDTHRR